MVISKSRIPQEHLFINQQNIESVSRYTCLDTVLTDQSQHSQQIFYMIEKARAVFFKITSVLKNRSLSLTTKVRRLRCNNIFSVLLYLLESWIWTEHKNSVEIPCV